ncbi:aminoglycoside phosphotransferase [Actinophytocola sp.]|uniref:aminoglycoside phosphotransferase n=1 Tax=Actinophytocola sp. TaxID=1872138 RepID=UPI0025BBC62C|nr:aminoglycoside phosphotransferase [Actinophytocola sp.]
MPELEVSAADAAHRAWLTDLFANAAERAQATVAGEPVFGWNDRSAGAPVATADGERWLRLVVEQQAWAGGEFWTGNGDANVITGVAKPRVLEHCDWTEGPWAVRAELMTQVHGTPCSPTPDVRAPIDLPSAWWSELTSSLAALATVATERVHLRQADVTRRLEVFFGDRAGDPTVSRWTAAHADLHWANLLAPHCVLVDWEGWGLAPAGYDAACLYVHTLLEPASADKVHAELVEHLDTRDGLLAQLYATTRLLQRVDHGDYPGLAIPLHHNVNRVIAQLTDDAH